MIEIQLPYPVSNNNYYRRGRFSTYIGQSGIAYKSKVQQEYTGKIALISEYLAVGVTLHPKLTVKGQPYKKGLDIDNYFKCLWDSLIGIVYIDDSQIKRYDYVQYGEAIIGGQVSVRFRKLSDLSAYSSGY